MWRTALPPPSSCYGAPGCPSLPAPPRRPQPTPPCWSRRWPTSTTTSRPGTRACWCRWGGGALSAATCSCTRMLPALGNLCERPQGWEPRGPATLPGPCPPACWLQCKQPFNGETPHAILAGSFTTPAELHFIRNHLPLPQGLTAEEHRQASLPWACRGHRSGLCFQAYTSVRLACAGAPLPAILCACVPSGRPAHRLAYGSAPAEASQPTSGCPNSLPGAA